jgi:adenine-specific DNA glycosylase
VPGTEWLAAKCRMKDCPLAGSPFECPFQKPCTAVQEADWDAVSVQEEEEDHGNNS